MSTSRTLHLIERRSRLCRLAPAEVDFLLAHHRTHLEVLPTHQRHIYKVTPAGIAGIIVTPCRRIIVSSKVPLRQFLILCDQLPDSAPVSTEVQPDDGSDMIDLLAGQLALRMSERACAGLHRAYREASNQGAYLVGQLDISAQLRQPPGRKDQIHSRQDSFTLDVAYNQVPRLVAGSLLATGLLGAAVRERLTRALASFADVGEVPLTPDVLAQLQRDRLPPAYVPLIDLCRLLIDSLGPTLAGGAVPAPVFVLSLERLFERYLTRAVTEAFAASDLRVGVQESYSACDPIAGQPAVQMRPDVSLEQAGRVLLVVDAKWKHLPASALLTDDLYQVLAYTAALGLRAAVLVYPGRRRRIWEYVFPHIHARVQVRTLNVSGTMAACLRAKRRLRRDLRRLVRESSTLP